jgi:hypothetical protein
MWELAWEQQWRSERMLSSLSRLCPNSGRGHWAEDIHYIDDTHASARCAYCDHWITTHWSPDYGGVWEPWTDAPTYIIDEQPYP